MSNTARPDVKLAGSESKDKMYEPKHKKKLVRVLTVVAYVFSVSLAAITLSLFYWFIYNPDRPGKSPIFNNGTRTSVDYLANRTAPEEPRALPVQSTQSPQINKDVTRLHPDKSDENREEMAYHTRRNKRGLQKMANLKNT